MYPSIYESVQCQQWDDEQSLQSLELPRGGGIIVPLFLEMHGVADKTASSACMSDVASIC